MGVTMWQGMATIYNWRDFIASAANFPLTIPDSFSPQIFTDLYIKAINPTQRLFLRRVNITEFYIDSTLPYIWMYL